MVVTVSARKLSAVLAPVTPWLVGGSPVRSVVVARSVQDDWETATVNTRPRAASRSSAGVGLGVAP